MQAPYALLFIVALMSLLSVAPSSHAYAAVVDVSQGTALEPRKDKNCDPNHLPRRHKDWFFMIEIRRYRSAMCGHGISDKTDMIGGPGKRWEITEGMTVALSC